jgi:hypothetical protein
MVHVRQCFQNGGLDQFGYQYFVEYKRGKQKYEDNLMEREAYDLQSRFAKTNQLSWCFALKPEPRIFVKVLRSNTFTKILGSGDQ